MKQLDVIIVGASLAGLACAACLANAREVVVLVEKSAHIHDYYSVAELLAIKDALKLLELAVPSNHLEAEPIDYLRSFIESHRGEIITSAPVISLKLNPLSDVWTLETAFGEMQTKTVVLATPAEVAQSLILPVFGKEKWIGRFFTDNNFSYNLFLAKTSSFGLFLTGDYLQPSKNGKIYGSMISGNKVANQILNR